MRAVVYEGKGGGEVIAVREDVPEPVMGSDDALVEVAYAGLNRADVLERAGHYPMPKRDLVIAGLEFSGTVVATGPQVSNVTTGDRVCGLVQAGAHAQRLTTHALTLSKVPDGVDLATAAAIPEAFITAHDALFTQGGFGLGQVVLVHAVGSGVGLAAVGLAKRAGGFVIGTSRTPEKLERAREHGMDVGVLLDDGWRANVHAASSGRGADVILDFIGASILDANLGALAPRGRLVQIGTMGGVAGSISLGILMAKRATIHGTVLRSRPLDEKIVLAKRFERELLPLFARSELRAEIDRVFPLAEIREAHAYMESNANFGKIILQLSG